jgi:pyrroloquinoline-quinone synthase
VLRHPFYLRWNAGELTRAELRGYAGEYRHAVVALAAASQAAADRAPDASTRRQLADHAAEERAHVALWDDFCASLGAGPDARPIPETLHCARAWAGDEDRPWIETLVTLYAIESAQPEISRTKLDGLHTHYGVEETAYFEVHAERDVEHAREEAGLIEAHLEGADHDRLLSVAESALRANWTLLDGVDRAGVDRVG